MSNLAFPSSTLGYGDALQGFGMPAQTNTSLGFGSNVPSMGGVDMNFGIPAIPQMNLPVVQPATSPLNSVRPEASPEGLGDTPGMWDRFKSSMVTEDGFNFDNIGSLAKTLGSLGTLWSGIQSNRIARDSLNFQKDSYRTNLANQTQSYNTQLQDRGAARAAQFGNASYADTYFNENKI